MPLPINIETLLNGQVVESARIEFKETWKPEASLKTICAFANDIDNWGGGYVVIGIEDNVEIPRDHVKGVPIGQVDKILKDLLNKCKLIIPEYLPIVDAVEYRGKKLIIVWCPGGQTRPYKCPNTFTYSQGKAKSSSELTYFIRKMASTIKPSTEEVKDLFSLANNVPFDDRINHQADLSDLNITLIKSYLKEINSGLYKFADKIPFEQLCIDMGISSSQPEYMKPRNIGLMFFAMEPEKFIPYTQIEVVEFPEGVGGNNIIEKYFKGPLHQQLREALLYIKNSVIKERIIKYDDRAEADHIFNYPYPAIEEALANAVYHKAYDVREPIEVRIEYDKIEIISYPGPDRSVSIEGLKKFHVSNRRYRNRRIGEFLKELHLTEGRNTGFKKILNALNRNGSPIPEFETDDGYTYFISRFFIHPSFKQNNPEEKFNHKNERSLSESVSESVSEYLNIEEYKILVEYVYENEHITSKIAAEKIGKSEPTARRYLKKLVDLGVVEKIGRTNKVVYKKR